MSVQNDSRSVATLLTDLLEQVSTLFRTETRLLRAELQEKVAQAGSGAMEIVAGAICLLAALLVLLQALVVGVAEIGDMGVGWASLIVGVIVAIIGAILVRRGISNMSPSDLTPDRTASQLRQDMQVAKEQLK